MLSAAQRAFDPSGMLHDRIDWRLATCDAVTVVRSQQIPRRRCLRQEVPTAPRRASTATAACRLPG